jgi:hypothetical protein
MPSTEAPNWWADVQQEREDLAAPGRRPAEDWLGEDIDFVPRRRMARADVTARDDRPVARVATPADTAPPAAPAPIAPRTRRTAASPAAARAAAAREAAEAREAAAAREAAEARAAAAHPLHGVFVPTAPHAPVRASTTGATSMTIELTTEPLPPLVAATPADVVHELAHLSAADDPFASPPPPAGTRRTVQIKGRPDDTAGRPRSMAQRHRPRTASDRVGPRPDRIALWAVALGAILIILAATTSSSQAAVSHRAATAPAVSAKVSHAAHHAPAPLARTLR